MALQFVIQSKQKLSAAPDLGKLNDPAEIFQITEGLWGISVPTKVVDTLGESEVRASLSKFNVFDLYAGEWRYA